MVPPAAPAGGPGADDVPSVIATLEAGVPRPSGPEAGSPAGKPSAPTPDRRGSPGKLGEGGERPGLIERWMMPLRPLF
jgi:hypothetical protein